MPKYSAKRPSTKKRHELIRKKFNEFIKPNEHGLRPGLDDVYIALSDTFGYEVNYIQTIMKN